MTELYIFGFFIDSSIGLPLFFVAGLYLALSPCLFPLMPFALLRMFSAESRNKALALTGLLLAGILSAFFVFFFLTNLLSEAIPMDLFTGPEFSAFLGAILVFAGLVMVVPQLKTLFARIPILFQGPTTKETMSLLDVYFLGIAFSFISLPCAFPVFLGLVSIMIAVRDPVFSFFGFPLMAIGISLPYLILALSSHEMRRSVATAMAKNAIWIERIVAAIMILLGIGYMLPLIGFVWWEIVGDALTYMLVVFIILAAIVGTILYLISHKDETSEGELETTNDSDHST